MVARSSPVRQTKLKAKSPHLWLADASSALAWLQLLRFVGNFASNGARGGICPCGQRKLFLCVCSCSCSRRTRFYRENRILLPPSPSPAQNMSPLSTARGRGANWTTAAPGPTRASESGQSYWATNPSFSSSAEIAQRGVVFTGWASSPTPFQHQPNSCLLPLGFRFIADDRTWPSRFSASSSAPAVPYPTINPAPPASFHAAAHQQPSQSSRAARTGSSELANQPWRTGTRPWRPSGTGRRSRRRARLRRSRSWVSARS